MKKLSINSFVFCFTLVIVYGCGNSLNSKNLEADIPPRFKGCIVTRDMLSDGWQWQEYSSSISIATPTAENQYSSLNIFSRIYGRHKETNYGFHISSIFNEYDLNFDLENDSKYDSTPFENVIGFNPNFHQTGKEMIYSCGKEIDTKNPGSFICYIQVGFEKHSSIISISGPSESNTEEIEGIVNPLLDSINACVSKIENN